MAEAYFPFQTGAGTSVTEAYWSMMARLFVASGVVKGALNELQVYADSSGMQVKVKSGRHAIMGLMYQSDAEQIIPIAAADPANPRIDVIAIRLDWVANTIAIVVLEGVPAANPVAPALTQTDILVTPGTARWEIALANVNVPAAAATIAAGNITDERTYTGFPPSSSATANTVVERDANGAGTLTELTRTNPSAFRVYQSVSQAFSANVLTKVLFQTKVYDNLTEYDATANYRFTAKNPGYYMFSACLNWPNTTPANTYILMTLYVNGARHTDLYQNVTGGNYVSSDGAGRLKLNANDYVEVYVQLSNALTLGPGSAPTIYFEGIRIA